MPVTPVKTFRLYNEDCLEVLPRLPPGSIDLVLCDPPYGTTNLKWDSIIPADKMWKELSRVNNSSDVVILTAYQPFTTFLIQSNLKRFRYLWVWNKVNRLTGHLNAKKMPLRITEDVLVFYSSQPAYNPQKVPSSTYRASSGKQSSEIYNPQDRVPRTESSSRYPSNLLSIPADEPGKKRNGRGHPTQKPVTLMEYLIRTYSNPGDLVLDFAMGSGTTGVACGNLGRRFIGIENDTERGYFEVAKERIEKAYAENL